jgi:hypothetical protein
VIGLAKKKKNQTDKFFFFEKKEDRVEIMELTHFRNINMTLALGNHQRSSFLCHTRPNWSSRRQVGLRAGR